MGETDATILVAMAPTTRRQRIEELLSERGLGVFTADDGIRAVDRIRQADVVLVGDYPPQVASVVVDATTPPGVARPNVLLAPDDAELDGVPDHRLPEDADPERVLTAVESAVERATYTERVAAFSQAAAEAATSDRGTPALAERVAGLASDARAVQTEFSPADWTAAFRSLARSTSTHNRPRSRNRTS